MRLLLIAVQAGIVAFIYLAGTTAVAGMGPSIPASGGGAAVFTSMALQIAAYVLILSASFAVFAGVLLPFAVALLLSLVSSVLCGYRVLRWTRWFGVLLNAAAAYWYLFAYTLPESFPPGARIVQWAVGLLFIFNGLLFLALPKRPE